MFTDEVSQKGAKDMSQKNMEVMLSMEDKAEAEELTAFLQSVNITKQTLMDTFLKCQGGLKMLKTDYKGFGEFMEKIKTAGEEETRTLCGIRQQMWLNEISDFIFPTPAGDLPFLINALEILAQTIKKTNPEAKDCARKIINGTGWEVQASTINKNMSEAAAKVWRESVKNNKGIM